MTEIPIQEQDRGSEYSRRDFIRKAGSGIAALSVCSVLPSGNGYSESTPGSGNTTSQTETSGMETREFDLGGPKVKLSQPWVATELKEGRCWYPSLLGFGSGKILLAHSLVADSNYNFVSGTQILISNDNGKTFNSGFDMSYSFVLGPKQRPNGKYVCLASNPKPEPMGQYRNFSTHCIVLEDFGRKYSFHPFGAIIRNLPRDIEALPNPSRTSFANLALFGDILSLRHDFWLASLYGRFQGDERYTSMVIASKDQGHSWDYLATPFTPENVSAGEEGPCESCLTQLTNGHIMMVARSGNMNVPLARSYSRDSGKTWSEPDSLPAKGVAPRLIRLQNGCQVLSTGREGIHLWISPDEHAEKWYHMDIKNYHNSVMGKEHFIDTSDSLAIRHQTTAYTGTVEIEPNRFLLAYDRIPFGWEGVPADSGEVARIYLLEITVG